MNLTGRTALVTGATGGIGQAIARALVAAGAGVRLSGRRVDVLEPLARELNAEVVAADLADRADVARLAESSRDVDVLVANAALPASGPLQNFSVEEIDRALDVNLRAPILLARELSIAMRERGAGQIVLISSIAGKTTTPGSSLYSATKYGLRGFGHALRGDLHGSGVGVSVVFPGFIRDAGMFHDSGAELPSYVGTRTPEQVAAAVISAIEHDRGEVDVAPPSVRAGAIFAQVAPSISARITRRLGSEQLSQEIAAGQNSKR